MILTRLRNALDRKLQRFLKKEYRDGYLETHVRAGIAHQIRALRMKAGLTQEQFAIKTAKKQSTISRLESTDYGRVSIQSLLDVATAFDVALLVRFVDYPEFLRVTSDMSERALAPESVYESQARIERAEQVAIVAEFFGDLDRLGEQRQARGAERLENVGPWANLAVANENQSAELFKWN